MKILLTLILLLSFTSVFAAETTGDTDSVSTHCDTPRGSTKTEVVESTETGAEEASTATKE